MEEALQAMQIRYTALTSEALALASAAPVLDARTAIIIDMASRYVQDAAYFNSQGDLLRSIAALSYAHGWLDCGARLRFFHVTDDRLFTIDPREFKTENSKQ